MEATLWNGIKQIKGELEFFDDRLVFNMNGFNNSNISLKISYININAITFKKIYSLECSAIKIRTIDDKEDIFVVEQLHETMSKMDELIKINRIKMSQVP
jgi:trehalose utilization protein